MELDLTEYHWLFIALIVILLLAGLSWLGHAYLPAGDQPLTWSEWQVFKARNAYQKELGDLLAAADTLAALLNAQPDPVRTQLAAESIQRLTSEGQPALAFQREKLTLAAQATSDWAVGAIDHATARQALNEAIESLPLLPSRELTPLPTPISPGMLLPLSHLPRLMRN